MAFPIIQNQGIAPGGVTATELNAITRRGFIPFAIDQFRRTSPLATAFLDNGVAISGGLNPITQPVKMNAMTVAQTVGYDGSFNAPSQINGMVPAQFNLKGIALPIGFLGMESVIQDEHDVVNRLEAVMVDASDTMLDFFTAALMNNTTDNSNIIGLPGAVDDGTNLVTYGGLSRTTYPQWSSYVRVRAGTPAPTRQLVMNDIVNTMAGATGKGERPTMLVTDPGTWALLENDFQGQERFVVDSGGVPNGGKPIESGYPALMVGGVPVYMDQNVTPGTIWILNLKYLSLHIHTGAFFAFTGWHSAIVVQQFGYIGAFLTLMELVCNRPSTQGRVSGYSSAI
jgi:hypothetical protein